MPFGETRVFLIHTLKRAHFFSEHIFPVSQVFLHDTTILISLVFELLKRCWECLVVACTSLKSKKRTCISQCVKLCCELSADGLRPVCLSLVCTKGQGLASRTCPECPGFLTCAWGPHTVRTSCDVTHICNQCVRKFCLVLSCSSAPRFPFCNSVAWSI